MPEKVSVRDEDRPGPAPSSLNPAPFAAPALDSAAHAQFGHSLSQISIQPPQSAPASGGDGEYTDYQHYAEYQEAMSYAPASGGDGYSAYQPADPQAESAPPAPDPVPEAPPLAPPLVSPQARYPNLKPMDPAYGNETASFPHLPNERTGYLSERGRDKRQLAFGPGGAVTHGGKALDTMGAKSLGAGANADKDSHIMVMDENGAFYSANSHAETAATYRTGNPLRFHHSSFLAGAPVAGAGTIRAQGGHVQSVSDKSGHYKPTGDQTLQVVQELDRQGAMTDTRPDASGHAVNKSAEVVLGAKGQDKEVSLRAHQYLQTGGNEAQIRAKMDLNKQITGPRPALKPLQAEPSQPELPRFHEDDGDSDIKPPQFHEDSAPPASAEYKPPQFHQEDGYTDYQSL